MLCLPVPCPYRKRFQKTLGSILHRSCRGFGSPGVNDYPRSGGLAFVACLGRTKAKTRQCVHGELATGGKAPGLFGKNEEPSPPVFSKQNA
ncbi:MAG: hypothetical protein ABII68_03680 [Pseudomonadota bacterium]